MPFTLDPTTDFGARVAAHLADDQVVWLTTVRADGRPEPSPVWFLWDGETVLIYSQENTLKLRNIAARPHVSLNFNATFHGGDVVVISGHAEILPDAPRANEIPAYLSKYSGGIESISMTPQSFADGYPAAIRVTPTHLRGH